MVLLLTAARGQPGEVLEIQNLGQSPQLALIQDILVTLASYGTQTAWAIDATNGDDSAAGTPAAPLRTMGQFNARMTGLLVTAANPTLQLVGDVVDQPLMLNGTRFLTGSTLTVSGTRTALASGCTISVVTALGGNPIGSSFPWQLTTAGVDWTTTPAGAQIRFSNGSIGWIAEVVDANNVICSPATSTGITSVPTTALTFSVETLSAALPPFVAALSTIAAGGDTLVMQDLALQSGVSSITGVAVSLNGCEIIVTATPTWNAASLFRWIRCRFTCANAAILRMRSAPLQWQSLGCTYVGASGAQSPTFIFQGGQGLFNVTTMLGMKLSVFDNSFVQIASGMHFRNTVATGASGLITIAAFGRVYVLNAVNGSINGAIGNTGVMFDVRSGEFAYSGSTSRPTATATVGSEVRLNNQTALAYAAIPLGFRTLRLDAIPPTTVELSGDGMSAWGLVA